MNSAWPAAPVFYELNTAAWLHDVGARAGRPATLGSVPDAEWDAVTPQGVDAVWLMGVWQRSPVGVELARPNEEASWHEVLPDLTDADVIGSAYCIRSYVVDDRFGGRDGLAAARAALAARGKRLLVDFVPNHVAPDHAWTTAHPEYFVAGSEEELERDPASFVKVGDRVLANGRDPYFPAWPDVVQLNAFSSELRRAVIDTLGRIAEQCDGVRCDMAMLMMNDIFERTWGERAGARPADDYWPAVIEAVRSRRADFVFMAEAYWDLEYALQQEGFDYCYDKRLYDRLVQEDAGSVRGHLTADTGYQERLVRFVENHDEPRAAATFPPAKARAAAVATLAQTGARLVHEGQLDGRRAQLPVFLGRRPHEEPDAELRAFYERLLGGLRDGVCRTGEWQLGERSGWDGNATWENLVVWGWRDADAPRKLVVVNLGDAPAAAHVSLPWDELRGTSWRLADALSDGVYERSGDDLRDGLYVALDPWASNLFDLTAQS